MRVLARFRSELLDAGLGVMSTRSLTRSGAGVCSRRGLAIIKRVAPTTMPTAFPEDPVPAVVVQVSLRIHAGANSD